MSPAMQHFVSLHFTAILLIGVLLLYMLVTGRLGLKAMFFLALMIWLGSYWGAGGLAGKAVGGVNKTGDMTEQAYESCLSTAITVRQEGPIAKQWCASGCDCNTQNGWDACMEKVLCTQGSDGGDSG